MKKKLRSEQAIETRETIQQTVGLAIREAIASERDRIGNAVSDEQWRDGTGRSDQ
jgi:hypothetical protein